MVRRAETNIGNFCADAFRDQSGADIALVNGGAIRKNIEMGEVTVGDIMNIHPYGNMLCMMEVSGQQILDALEWGARVNPEENGGFMQPSGLSYEIDVDIPSPCIEDDKKMFVRTEGERRVKNVMVGDEPLDPEKVYKVAGMDYLMMDEGDGFTMFKDGLVLLDRVKIDHEVLLEYFINTLHGVIGSEYSDPYGQGRIIITGAEE